MERIFLLCCLVASARGEPIVSGKSLGKIIGKIEEVLDTHIESFLGIPYAKPPLGQLRFALPQPYGGVGELQATKYPPSCLQVTDPSVPLGDEPPNEDCLYLNVFRKHDISNHRNGKKAVSDRSRLAAVSSLGLVFVFVNV